MTDFEILHAHLFCGIGAAARGFNRGEARVGKIRAKFTCLGGIDVDRGAIADFERLASVKGTVLDMFNLEQYRAFHGRGGSSKAFRGFWQGLALGAGCFLLLFIIHLLWK